MTRAVTPNMSRTARWLREYLPDRNPLRRAIDRAQATIVGLLLMAFLAVAPLAAIRASTWTNGPHPVAQQTRYHVAAVLLASVPRPVEYGYGGAVDLFARARWATPAGTLRTGEIQVSGGEKAGHTLMIWIDAAGRPAGPPVHGGREQPLASLAAVLVVAAVMMCTGKLGCWLLDRRRLAAWDADWRTTEPLWSFRRLQ